MSAVSAYTSNSGAHGHRVIIIKRTMLDSADEEVMLIHIYLHAGCPSVEILKGLGTVLQKGGGSEYRMGGRGVLPYVHHLWVTLAISAIEQV